MPYKEWEYTKRHQARKMRMSPKEFLKKYKSQEEALSTI